MRKQIRLLPLLLLLPTLALAEDTPAPKAENGKAAEGKPAAGKDSGELVTNVIGSQEAPTVLNVVPWKDKEVKIERKSPSTSILNQVLQPLDRDVLMREVQYFRSLQGQ